MPRLVIGQVKKSQATEERPSQRYLSFFLAGKTKEHMLELVKEGKFNVSMETIDDAKEGLLNAYKADKLSEDYYRDQMEKLEKTPEWVTHQLFVTYKKD